MSKASKLLEEYKDINELFIATIQEDVVRGYDDILQSLIDTGKLAVSYMKDYKDSPVNSELKKLEKEMMGMKNKLIKLKDKLN